ncbi:MAG: hypothetical protein QOF48_2376 [Verrucomicrobiota bacterium]
MRRPGRWCFAAWLAIAGSGATLPAAEVFHFRSHDVVAFVGGEDVVEMQRNGFLEFHLTAVHPDLKLRFRSLAFEGDTVFEQHRQLNFPSWEKQLDRIGATVVVVQFGQLESLEGTNALPRFIAAYGKLLDRFTNGSRRIVVISPTPFHKPPAGFPDRSEHNRTLLAFTDAIREAARTRDAYFVGLSGSTTVDIASPNPSRDGVHLSRAGQWMEACDVAAQLGVDRESARRWIQPSLPVSFLPEPEQLRQLIIEKNRLWFDYWRPQNWAFLNGDRTDQPSSHDHRDLKKRWFPEEMEKFLPLIDAKEEEIWDRAKKLR